MSFEQLSKQIEQYKPLKDIETIIVETNRIFHDVVSSRYDKIHSRAKGENAPIYTDMCKLLPTTGKLRILDFGCGTGFAAEQLIKALENIELLCCYDISDEMLEKCKQNITRNTKMGGGGVLYVNNFDDMPNVKFNVLVTNGVLHHLADPMGTIASLKQYISDDCYYIMGSEPNSRYYRNHELLELTKESRSRLLRLLQHLRKHPYSAIEILRRYVGTNQSEQTARKTVESGLFALKPSRNAIDRIVELRVHRGTSSIDGGGFDFLSMSLHDEWELVFSKTFNFLGNRTPYYMSNKRERRKYTMLEAMYPSDGRNFCCVWKRKQAETLCEN